MARKPNYGFDKRRKEQDRKAKKDAKLADKQRRREEEAAANAENPGNAQANGENTSPVTPDE